MTLLHLITASLRHHVRIHAAVALGVLVATAVLTGALLVGDSMRGSLRHLTLDRLGRIEELLVVDRFFRSEVAAELQQSPAWNETGYQSAVPAILLANTSIERQGGGGRASGVLTIGCDEQFFTLFPSPDRYRDSPPARPIAPGEVILNEPLAKELRAKVGDLVVLRLPSADQVAADSPLGRKEDRVLSLPELKVAEIYPAAGIGRFSLRPNQALPMNAYVATATLQDELQQPDRVNALLVGSSSRPTSDQAHTDLAAALRPTLGDLGLKIRRVTRKWRDETVYDYFELTSDRMLLEPELVAAAQQAFATEKPQVLFIYLANTIERLPDGDDDGRPQLKPISYSTICAVNPSEPLGPTFDEQGKLLAPISDGEIIVNDWVQRDQELKVGDKLRLTYFEPETTHGQTKDTWAEFTVRGFTPLTIPPQGENEDELRPTPANDPHLTPEVAGVTDKASINDWDAFPVDRSLVRHEDDKYWQQYATTPKAFVSLAAGQKLWGSRWGNVTTVRFPASDDMTVEQLEDRLLKQLHEENVTLGFDFQPIKLRDLKASSGTTPFGALFLFLSMFIVAAAVILVLLLFRLGVEQRASEIGVLLGLGWTRQKVGTWLIGEGALVAALGAALGVLAGVGYAWLMIVGLTTWWRGAVGTTFLELYIPWHSLVIGYVSGVVVSVVAIWWGLQQSRRVAIRRLLAGQAADDLAPGAARFGWLSTGLAVALLAAAIGLAFLAMRLRADAQAGAFLGSGMAVLTAVLLLVRQQLRGGAETVRLVGSSPLARLALRSAARNPARSVLTLALVASASFLIVALSAFRLNPSRSGSGGFAYVAESAQPMLVDLNQPAQQKKLLGNDDAALLQGGTILPFRLQPGDDASCRNLYQPAQPRVLGVTPELIEYYNDPAHTPFDWSSSAAKAPAEQKNPWRLLSGAHAAGEPVPVVIDQNTAMYSLRLYRGVGEEFPVTYPGGQKVTFRVVGLLSNSVLQGSLLIGESDFQRLFPQTSGYRYFLVNGGPGNEAKAAAALEDHLNDQGFDAKDAKELLADLMAVQNTYLSTFQALGALGLVLGTFGLAAVQVRTVLERRGELGLLRAAGYARSRLSRLVMLENIVLLLGGLAIGIIAALVAVLPHALVGGARPPVLALAIMLGMVVVVGCLVGWLSVRSTLRAPLIAALRGD